MADMGEMRSACKI